MTEHPYSPPSTDTGRARSRRPHFRGFVIAYIAATTVLLFAYLYGEREFTPGVTNVATLRLVLPKVLAVAVLPGIIGSLLPRQRWLLQIVCGIVLGPLTALVAVIAYEHWYGA